MCVCVCVCVRERERERSGGGREGGRVILLYPRLPANKCRMKNGFRKVSF